jgi:hypothetical protein
MHNIFISSKANKKPTNEKINTLDFININNFSPLKIFNKTKIQMEKCKIPSL